MEKRPYWLMPAPLEGEARILASRLDAAGLWVSLERSLFYPESGGQRCDGGTIGDRPVLEVILEGETPWHRLGGEEGSQLLEELGVLSQCVDARRRRDHQEQHSGQHLLSAVCLELLSAPTVSFHMGESVSTVELDCSELSARDLERIQERAWDLIREGRPIRAIYPDAEEAAALPLRRSPTLEKDLRVVVIEDLDWSPCGGTHVDSTAAIGALLLGRTERIRGRWRLEFTAGRRALKAGAEALARLRQVAEGLSCAGEELIDRVAALREENTGLRREARELRNLKQQAEASHLEASMRWEELPELGKLHSYDFGERPMAELAELARLLCRAPKRALLWSCREEGQVRVLLQRSRGPGPHLGNLLKELLGPMGGRGGGGPDRGQGSWSPSGSLELLAKGLKQRLEEGKGEA